MQKTLFGTIACLLAVCAIGLPYIPQARSIDTLAIYDRIGKSFSDVQAGKKLTVSSEYPPLTAILFAMVRNNPLRLPFHTAWILLLLSVIAVTTLYVRWRFGPQESFWFSLSILFTVLIFSRELIFGRFDLLIGLLLLLFWRAWEHRRITDSSIWLGIAISLKVTPILLLPLLFCSTTKPLYKRIFLGLGLAMGASILLPFIVVGSDAFFTLIGHILSYHASRGFQIESTWSGLHLLFTNALHGKAQIGWIASSHQNMDLPNFLFRISVAASITGIGFFAFFARLRPQWKNRSAFGLLLLCSILWMLGTSFILSPQYFVWIMPLLFFWIFIQFRRLVKRDRNIVAIASCITLIGFSTGWMYPAHYEQLVDQTSLFLTLILNFRNALIFALLLLLALELPPTGIHLHRLALGIYHDRRVRIVMLAIGITTVQLLLFWHMSGRNLLTDKYLAGFNWDSHWYGSISGQGYHSPVPPVSQNMKISNVVFFPAFPLLGRAFAKLLGVSTQAGLLMAAQAAAVIFWSYFLLLLQRWRSSKFLQIFAISVVLVHPVSFLLICAYSESLFLASLLGFIYWTMAGTDRRESLIAGLHGFVLSATRILGLPLAFFPILVQVISPKRKGTLFRMLRNKPYILLSCGLAVAGGILFFVYCQWRFGVWDLYITTQTVGWGFKADLLRFLDPSLYRIEMPSYDAIRGFKGNDINNSVFAVTLVAGLALVVWEYRGRQQARSSLSERLCYYITASFLLYMSITSRGIVWERNVPMMSMLRFCFPVHILLLLAALRRLSGRKTMVLPSWLWVCVVVLTLFFLNLQSSLVYQFIHADFRQWVP